jgi:hypothetical protein
MTTNEFEKKRFLLEQGLINSINAAVKRVKIYRSKMRKEKQGKYDDKKDAMRKDFANAVMEAAKSVIDANGDQTILAGHIKNVLAKLKSHQNIFVDGQPTFGIAQKALNLFLKYLWCLGVFKNKNCPPHCPIDSQVLNEISWAGETWPLFTKTNYDEAIGEIILKKSKLIAEWELPMWRSSLKIEKDKFRVFFD